MEEWKDIIGYENLYQISNKGNVKSTRRNKLLKLRLHKDGYYNIQLYYKMKMKSFRVNRLVAIHFVDNPHNKPFVNHKNGIKTDNFYLNLEWNTHEENMEHAKTNNLIKKGKESPLCGNKNASKNKSIVLGNHIG